MAASEIVTRLNSVLQRIDAVCRLGQARAPRLVAVSKTKPVADIVEAYTAGQRYFGENYVQELLEKSQSEDLRRQCPEIRWHFIGHCQSKNAKKLAQVQNLDTVETIDSEKLATVLHKEWTKTSSQAKRLRVFIQVNTSSEEQKHGCQLAEVAKLAGHVIRSCPAFDLAGLMTIGSLEASGAGEYNNADFERLLQCRREVSGALGLPSEGQLELSMGMSADFELAIQMGSSNVRVGSTIFGSRNYS